MAAVTGGQIGDYLDPQLVANPNGGDIIINPSWGIGIMSVGGEVPMIDGRTAIVNSEGIIVDFE